MTRPAKRRALDADDKVAPILVRDAAALLFPRNQTLPARL
jgi:hypothetical protein